MRVVKNTDVSASCS